MNHEQARSFLFAAALFAAAGSAQAASSDGAQGPGGNARRRARDSSRFPQGRQAPGRLLHLRPRDRVRRHALQMRDDVALLRRRLDDHRRACATAAAPQTGQDQGMRRVARLLARA